MSDVAEGWEGERADRWVRMSAGLERQLAPVSAALFVRAAIALGERILDVGCGTGPTTRAAAVEVGRDGSVTGLDLVATMIDAARDAAPPDGDVAPIDWIEADATTWKGPDAAFDAVVSQFGVMFFDDPPAAFANLARMTAPGGRLHVAVWAERSESPFFQVPLDAAIGAIAATGATADVPPADAGPFSLARRDAVVPMLVAAGWTDIDWEPELVPMAVGGGHQPAEAAAASMDLGPVRILLGGVDEATRRAAAEAIASTYEQYLRDGQVVLDGSIIIVSARRA